MKKTLSVLLALVLCMSFVFVSCGDDSETVSTGLTYTSNGDGTCTVSGIGTCTDDCVTIPATNPNGDRVTAIGDGAFANCSNLKEVSVPAGVIAVGSVAFLGCTNLEIVVFHGKPTIAENAFDGCPHVVVGYAAAEDSGSDADPSHKHTVVVDAAVAATCTASGLTEGSHCSTCGEILTVQEKIDFLYHDYVDGICTHCGGKCSIGLEYTSNGDGTCALTGIGTCTDTDLVIPPFSPDGDLVTSIGEGAFNLGYEKGILTSVVIPNSVKTIGESAFVSNVKMKSVTLPEGLLSIEDYAFMICEQLSEINLPNSVTHIGESAFSCCEALTSFTIPGSVTNLGSYAFSGCYGLTDVTISGGITNLPEQLFRNCEGLTCVIIPESVTEIGAFSFLNCKSLTRIIYAGNEAQWESVTKGGSWDEGSGNYRVEYSDGSVSDHKNPIPAGACEHCLGSGQMLCPKCNGTLVAVGENENGDRIFVKCNSCTEKDTVYTCMYCNGSGSANSTSSGNNNSGNSGVITVTCQHCHGSGTAECGGCDGAGQYFSTWDSYGNKIYRTCMVCSGLGTRPCAYCGGDGQFP